MALVSDVRFRGQSGPLGVTSINDPFRTSVKKGRRTVADFLSEVAIVMC